jgi:hypothetical protein
MLNLPKELTQNVAMFLDPLSITSLCQTNSKINYRICRDENFWYNKTVQDYPTRIPKSNYGRSWKEIYKLLTERSRVIFLERTISGNIYTPEDIDLPDVLIDITNTINSNQDILVLRGDIILLSYMGEYRNDGKFIWDGEKAIPLDYNLDDYGHVPRSMQFPEFPPDHFVDSISHNRIFHLSQESKEEFKRNYNPETMTSYVTDQYKKYNFKIYNENGLYTITLSSIPDELLERLEYELDSSWNIIIHLDFEVGGLFGNVRTSINEIPDYMIGPVSDIVFDPNAKVVWNNDRRFTITK